MNLFIPQKALIKLTRFTLCVMLLCYLPHVITAPKWLFFLMMATMIYRLVADYFAIPLLNKWIRASLVFFCLLLVAVHYGSIISSGFFIGFLLTFIGLKVLEVHDIRDIKVLIFCNFYLIATALIIIQELWIIAYLFVAILANCALMLKLNAPAASLRQLSGKSMKKLLVALPISILLFYIFPRITTPLWQVPSFGQSETGFSEQMSPGSISELFNDDHTALRITFKDKPMLNRYWRGLTLSFYNGVSWNLGTLSSRPFPPLNELTTQAADYEIMLEPHQKKWLFYTGYPIAGRPNLLFSPSYGLIGQNLEQITQRFSYSLKISDPPRQHLSKQQRLENTQLPQSVNPQLKAWAREQFALNHGNTKEFIGFLKSYIEHQPFWYTLSPPNLNSERNKMDAFWFRYKQGFCEHYASAVTLILRSVGIPSRVVVGYQGGEWNTMARYLNIRQKDAHAWLEYWDETLGWQLFDPTAFIAASRIEQTIRDYQQNRFITTDYADSIALSWLARARLFLDSARFFSERWLLFYNQDTQRELIHNLGLGQWNMAWLLYATCACFILFLLGLGIYFRWQHKRQDPLHSEYLRLQQEFRRFMPDLDSSHTLRKQCTDLIIKLPKYSVLLYSFLNEYERLRLQHTHQTTRENQNATINLFKKLRLELSKIALAHH